VLAAQHESVSISERVLVLRLNGLGGDRACRKLIHRLHRLNLLVIEMDQRDDWREKSVRISTETHKVLAELRAYLDSIALWSRWVVGEGGERYTPRVSQGSSTLYPRAIIRAITPLRPNSSSMGTTASATSWFSTAATARRNHPSSNC